MTAAARDLGRQVFPLYFGDTYGHGNRLPITVRRFIFRAYLSDQELFGMTPIRHSLGNVRPRGLPCHTSPRSHLECVNDFDLSNKKKP